MATFFFFSCEACVESHVRGSQCGEGREGGGQFWRLTVKFYRFWRLTIMKGKFLPWVIVNMNFCVFNISNLTNWRQFSCVCPVTPRGSADYFDSVITILFMTNNRNSPDARKTGVHLFFAITRSHKGQNKVKTRNKNARNIHFKIWRDQNQKLVSLFYCLMEKRETFY